MTATFLLIIAIVAALLTVWLLVVPVEVVAGAVKALRRGGRKTERRP